MRRDTQKIRRASLGAVIVIAVAVAAGAPGAAAAGDDRGGENPAPGGESPRPAAAEVASPRMVELEKIEVPREEIRVAFRHNMAEPIPDGHGKYLDFDRPGRICTSYAWNPGRTLIMPTYGDNKGRVIYNTKGEEIAALAWPAEKNNTGWDWLTDDEVVGTYLEAWEEVRHREGDEPVEIQFIVVKKARIMIFMLGPEGGMYEVRLPKMKPEQVIQLDGVTKEGNLILYATIPAPSEDGGSRDFLGLYKPKFSPVAAEGETGAASRPAVADRRGMVQVKEEPSYVLDEEAISRSHDDPPFLFKGGGTSGRVEDRAGKVLMPTGDETGIYGISISPDRKSVLAKGGSTNNYVLTPESGGKIRLPVTPPGKNVLGLEWDWLGDSLLFGESGVVSTDRNGKPLEGEEPVVAESRYYVYDLRTQQMTEVAMPEKYEHAVLAVKEVSPDGHVHFFQEGVPDAESDLGWFKIGGVEDRKTSAVPAEGEAGAASRPPAADRRGMVQVKEEPSYVLDEEAISRSLVDPPFLFKGYSTSGRVEDRAGKVLMPTGDEIGIYGISISPDRKSVLAKGGSTNNFVLTPESGGKIQLPVYPPGTNMLGLGDWYWIGDSLLLGESGVQAFERKGKPVGDDDNIAESRYYVYDLKTQQMTEVAMPAKYEHAVLGVMKASPDGHVHFFQEGVPDAESDLGWFKIGAK